MPERIINQVHRKPQNETLTLSLNQSFHYGLLYSFFIMLQYFDCKHHKHFLHPSIRYRISFVLNYGAPLVPISVNKGSEYTQDRHTHTINTPRGSFESLVNLKMHVVGGHWHNQRTYTDKSCKHHTEMVRTES